MAANKRSLLSMVGLSASAGLVLVSLSGYTGGPVTGGAVVSGTVKLNGAAPALRPHNVTKTPEICGATVPNEEVVVGGGGALANVVVWIDGIAAGAPAAPRPLTLNQDHCRYTPHVQTATKGSQITITSADDTLHNINGTAGGRSVFNIAMPVKGMRVQRPLRETGRVEIHCDAGHTWMKAFVHVFDHPYHAVTGPNGRFQLPDVPPGTYTIKAWHERFGERTAQLTVTAGTAATTDFTFAP